MIFLLVITAICTLFQLCNVVTIIQVLKVITVISLGMFNFIKTTSASQRNSWSADCCVGKLAPNGPRDPTECWGITSIGQDVPEEPNYI